MEWSKQLVIRSATFSSCLMNSSEILSPPQANSFCAELLNFWAFMGLSYHQGTGTLRSSDRRD